MDLSALLLALGVSAERVPVLVLAIMGAASMLAAVLPHPAEGSRWTFARRILDTLAGNLGNAANRTLADRLAVAMAAKGAAWPASPSPAAPPSTRDEATGSAGRLRAEEVTSLVQSAAKLVALKGERQ